MARLKLVFIWIFRFLALVIACGTYDVSRNKPLDQDLLKRYFLGNGLTTWLLSPLNTLLDILALPYANKGVYELADLPRPYQAEIERLIEAATHDDVVGKIEETAQDRARTMVFFKWFGEKVESNLDVPGFYEPYEYVQTIGVSVFNKKQSTSKHFGPFRATLRVLYNINDMHDDTAYIVVGGVKHFWKDKKLFIFDDTLMHQSFNESDQIRYCLFVDLLRPSHIPAFFAAVVSTVRICLRSVNYLFYQNWDVVKM